MPFITNKIISEKVVKRELYEEVKNERNQYSDMYEEQRKQVRMLSKDFDEISKNFESQSKQILNQTDAINKLNETINIERTEFQNTTNELQKTIKVRIDEKNEIKKINEAVLAINKEVTAQNEEYRNLYNDKPYWDNQTKYPSLIEETIKQLNEDKKLILFYQVASFINKGGNTDSDILDEMLNYKLIEMDSSNFPQLTLLGSFIYSQKKSVYD
ncbi:MAG: hypothetical protein IPK03_10250 [Bacteroidetes bacterium]|nr:hypothetical protein [Bacteroidota bacterium]